MGDRASAILKVQKLMALSKSANEHEAAAAALAAARVLAEYRLTEADIAEAAVFEHAAVVTEEPWVVTLATAIAAGCGCRLILRPPVAGLHPAVFVGSLLDTEAAARMLLRLDLQIRRLMEAGWKQHVIDLTDPHYGVYPSLLEEGAEAEWKAGFALGAVGVVQDRLLNLVPEARPTETESTALVRARTSRDEALNRADAYVRGRWPSARPAKGQTYRIHLGGLTAGKQTDVS